jgi:hypothetical protein
MSLQASGFEQAPLPGSQTPGWQASAPFGQAFATPDVQTPERQMSSTVQPLPSLHPVPSAAAGFEHAPLAGSHVPAAWHWSVAAQTTGFEPTQAPAWQASVCVQAVPSSQDVPSSSAGFEHVPLAGSQVPAAWHWSLAVHTTGFEPTQAPAWQASVCVQAVPSLQEVPSAAAGFEQAPFAESQVPATWHWSLAVQTTGFEPTHAPA